MPLTFFLKKCSFGRQPGTGFGHPTGRQGAQESFGVFSSPSKLFAVSCSGLGPVCFSSRFILKKSSFGRWLPSRYPFVWSHQLVERSSPASPCEFPLCFSFGRIFFLGAPCQARISGPSVRVLRPNVLNSHEKCNPQKGDSFSNDPRHFRNNHILSI
jgi:hypothetical protein